MPTGKYLSATSATNSRNEAPVFVLGSPRSGTTLLYDMLLSAGKFAVYLAESNVFNLLAPRFGDLAVPRNRQNLLTAWLNSKLFRATGLDSKEIEKKVLDSCRNPGDFLRTVMDEVSRSQGMQRWAENTPEGLLHMPAIKLFIPDALFIHSIRDGRDVAMSLSKVRYVRPFPWEKHQSLIGAGLYWEWMVQHCRKYGAAMGNDYMEVHFEDLIEHPQNTLDRIGQFIDQQLDYDVIRQVAYGSVSKPNTSFTADSARPGFNPVGRWKKGFSPEQLLRFECMMGPTLKQLGYTPATDPGSMRETVEMKFTRFFHRCYFEAKLSYKCNPIIRHLRPPLTSSEIDAMVLAEDHAPELKSVLPQSL